VPCSFFCFEQGIVPCSFFDRFLYSRPNNHRTACAVMIASSNPIERSFEIAAERCADLTPLVYERLHREHP